MAKYLIRGLDQLPANGEGMESKDVLPAYLPSRGLSEFPRALVELLVVLKEDVHVGGETVEEVLNKLTEREEVQAGRYCMNCNAAIDLASFTNEEVSYPFILKLI